MTVYRCEDTLESVFTAIYQAYEEKRDHGDTILSLTDDPFLFAEDIPVKADEEKCRKVLNTLLRRFGEEDCLRLNMALAAEDTEKAQAVYRTVVNGLQKRCRAGHLFDDLVDDHVNKAFSLGRKVGTEAGHQKQFLRFQQLENGVLFSRIGPKSDVLAFVMPHFADRLPMENFVIYDEKRCLFGIHPACGPRADRHGTDKHWTGKPGMNGAGTDRLGVDRPGVDRTGTDGPGADRPGADRPWYLLRGQETDRPVICLSEEEMQYQELFRQFCHTITIEERKNRKLQQNMLPLRFRKYMVEF